MKECKKCKTNKELAEFSIRIDSPDGYRNECKECTSEYLKAYHKNPPIKEVLEDGFKRCFKCKTIKAHSEFNKCSKNKDGLRGYCKVCHRKKNKLWDSEHAEYREKYKEENKEHIKEIIKEWRLQNKEKIVNDKKEYYKNNKDKINIRFKKWYEKNKEKVYDNKIRRRARKLGCNEKYGSEERKITFILFEYKCFKCGSKDNLCIDHHRPLIKGNALSINNAVLLCKSCNSSKGTKDPEEFYGKELYDILEKKLEKIFSNLNKNKEENNYDRIK
jgi:5-methylcytosine-specific restriction endonuclease McrA